MVGLSQTGKIDIKKGGSGMALRSLVFSLRGITEFKPTPPSLREKIGEAYRWYRDIRLIVKLPKDKQNSNCYPCFTKRLLEEIPQLSLRNGGLPCGVSGDFAERLREGTSMGHVWEHVYAYCFDMASTSLGYGAHIFRWQTKPVEKREEYTVYRIRMFHEVEPPPEFFGLESLVCGYLNALMEQEDFPIKERLKNFIEHRQEKEESEEKNEKEGGQSFLFLYKASKRRQAFKTCR